jgi:hypothetical protein
VSGITALGFALAALNLWALVDAFRHHPPDRAMWVAMSLAGLACGVSTAPFLVPVAVYTAIAYMAVGRPTVIQVH